MDSCSFSGSADGGTVSIVSLSFFGLEKRRSNQSLLAIRAGPGGHGRRPVSKTLTQSSHVRSVFSLLYTLQALPLRSPLTANLLFLGHIMLLILLIHQKANHHKYNIVSCDHFSRCPSSKMHAGLSSDPLAETVIHNDNLSASTRTPY